LMVSFLEINKLLRIRIGLDSINLLMDCGILATLAPHRDLSALLKSDRLVLN